MDAVLTSLPVRGASVRLLRGGAGPRIVFLHGAAGLSGWPEFFQVLAGTHEVWFPEHPGFGLTPELASIGSTAELAAYYRDFLREAGLSGCHVIGSSFGGWLAAELALLEGVDIRSLTLIGPAGLRPRVASAPPANEEAFVRKLYFDQAVAEKVLAEPMDEQAVALQKRNRAMTGKLGGAFHNPGLEQALRQLEVPGLVLWGHHDQLVPVEQAAQWQGCLRNSEMTIFSQCGHLPHFEQPRVVAQRIQAFLAQHS